MNHADPANGAHDSGAAPEPSTGLVITAPGDLIAAVPYMLGFHPDPPSLVVIGTHGPAGTCTLRSDLPADIDAEGLVEIGERLADMVASNDFATAFLIGYGSDEAICPAIAITGRSLLDQGVSVNEAMRVQEGRWWSYLCDNPECCPPEGTPYDPASTIIAAQATYSGLAALADRAALAASVTPLGVRDRSAMRQATQSAERRLREWAAKDDHPIALRARLRKSAIELIEELTKYARAGASPASDSEIAWLGVLLTDIRIRDEAWVRVETADIGFWRDVVRRVERRYAAAPASLLAYAAFIAGDGGLANVALDRAVDADPNYSMAALLRDVIAAGIPPAKARLRMTAEDLAAAYAELDPVITEPAADDLGDDTAC